MTLSEFLLELHKNYEINQNQTKLKFSDSYALVEAEIQKLNSLYAEKPNYDIVLKNSLDLLSQGSNDLLLFSYLAQAMVDHYQWPGFLNSLNFISKRLQDYWQSIQPEKQKSRIAALNWLLERYQKFMATQNLAHISKESLETLKEALNQFEQQLNEKFPQELSTSTLIKPITEQLQRLEAEASSKAAKQKTELDAARLQQEQALAAELQQNAKTISTDEYLAQMNTMELHHLSSKRLLQEHLELLRQQPLNFAIYKHNRAECWWHHPYNPQELLMHIDDCNFTWEKLNQALEQKAMQNYQEALFIFEQSFIEQPYFLETQMHIYECLEALGADANLCHMIKQETKQLLDVYPELHDAKIENKFAVLNKTIKCFLEIATKE